MESETDVGMPRSGRSRWIAGLFVVLLLVNLAPVVLLALMAEWSGDAFRDPTLPPAVVLVVAAPLVAWAGFLGTRRGWNAALLTLLALLTIAWPLFVAWVLLNMLCAAI
jgi:hypothetical protein